MSAEQPGLRIERLKIEAFGQLVGMELALAPGLNVLCGPNEAGKSTLMAFLRWMLFGFDRRVTADLYEPLQGETLGGELTIATARGSFVIRRRGKRTLDGDVTVRAQKGGEVGVAALSDALAGLSRALYCEVFAFGLDELASFEVLASQGAVADALFATGVQGGQRLPEALKALRQGGGELYLPRGRTQPLNQLLWELEQVRKALSAIGDPPARYFDLSARREALQTSVAALDADAEEARASLDRWTRLCASREELLALDEAEAVIAAQAQIAPLERLSRYADDAEARLEARLEARGRAEREHAEAALEEQTAEAARAALEQPSPITALCGEAEAAVAAYREVEALARALPAREGELLQARARGEARVAALGIEGGEARLAELDLSASALAQLATLQDGIAQLGAVLSERRAAARSAAEERSRRQEEQARLTAERQTLAGPAAELLRARQAALIRVGEQRAELRSVKGALDDREARVAALEGPSAPPPEPLLPGAWAAALALTVVAAAGGAFFWGATRPELAALWPGLVGAAALLLAAIGAVYGRSRRAHHRAAAGWEAGARARAQERARLLTERDALGVQAQALERTVAQELVAAALPEAAAPADVAVALEALSVGLRRAELAARLDAALASLLPRQEEAARQAEETAQSAQAAEAELTQRRGQLDAWCVARGLPTGLAAERVHALATEVLAAQELEREQTAAQRRLEADQARVAAASAPLLSLAVRLGAAHREPSAIASELERLLEGERTRLRRRDECRQRLEGLRLRTAQRRTLWATAEEAVAALVSAHGASTEEAFRQEAAAARRCRTAMTAASRLRGAMTARTGLSPEAVRSALAEGGGWPGAERAREEAAARVGALETARRSAAEERGAVGRELEALETASEMQRLRAEEESLKLRIAALAERYAVERLALSLVETARKRYEAEHQPRLLQIASAVFRQLSRGRYVQVRTPDEGGGLVALGSDGELWTPERLSRGAREQLYLAFRIAAVEDLGQTRARLPVILDDVLVNFDGPRAAAAADAIADLASRNQVFGFTCHPHLAELLTQRGGKALQLGSGPVQQQLLRLPA